MIARKYILMVLCVLLCVIWGCGPKPIPKESVLDTPDNHYRQGLRELDAGQLDAALEEFNRATALNPDYAGGFVGVALVKAAQNDFEGALEMVNKGISKDSQFIDGYIAKGRILTQQKKDDNWIKKAVYEFDKALKINPQSEKAMFYKGMAHKEAYQFNEAADAFKQVISVKKDFAQAADDEWALIQKILRAAPGTRDGKRIALISEIDRSDLAVLFIEELKLLEILKKKQPKKYDTAFRPPTDPTEMDTEELVKKDAITDIEGHWAKNWIKDAVKAGAIDLFPDHTFHPDEKISRANYAVFLQNILLAVTGDEALATKYIGTDSRFPDVNSTHYAYNAICLAVDRGIMSADTIDGAFGMSEPVSGADALLIIRELQNALRMTFE